MIVNRDIPDADFAWNSVQHDLHAKLRRMSAPSHPRHFVLFWLMGLSLPGQVIRKRFPRWLACYAGEHLRGYRLQRALGSLPALSSAFFEVV